MPAATHPADCVCNLSGHCAACLAAGLRCARPGCLRTRFDGVRCSAPARRAPAMPLPELADDGSAGDCVRALELHDAPAPAVDLVAALRASVDGPGSRALAHALARPFGAETPSGFQRMPLDECRRRAARASSESRPGRALTLDDLDAHERRRYAAVQPAGQTRRPSRQLARGAA